MTNEPICNVIIRAWFVRHCHFLERAKTFVLGLVFVLAHEQAIRMGTNWNIGFADLAFDRHS